MKRIYNFSAGPGILPQDALDAASEAVIDYNNNGISILEMSHRSQPVIDLMNKTSSLARELLLIPDNFHILWLQGGASTQFSMIPMNLLPDEETADYTDTGLWAAKAIDEAKAFGNINIVSSSKESMYNLINKDLRQTPKAIYLHITSNNTIYGTQWKRFPKVLNPNGFIISDMSSDIFSRKIDFNSFGLIYAGAQKNMGPAGVTMVIIRDDILGKMKRHIPTMFNYSTHINKSSAYNTPPVSAIFVVYKTLEWLHKIGGVAVIEEKNKIKSDKLYGEIERSSVFTSPIRKEDRSQMNVPFIFIEERDENEFLKFCSNRGLITLKGHRSVGGFRASIYNAMPVEGVDALISAMQDYESMLS
ncbi:MAG: 3-phosphoserine/phosphohydroxythreonine transaminase [Candidatus Neomarinimicrobiota bacterium]|tara:strand:- start:1192 stop:2274 length:1083 start_codon:yes stop_codon:yes gene_type:complete